MCTNICFPEYLFYLKHFNGLRDVITLQKRSNPSLPQKITLPVKTHFPNGRHSKVNTSAVQNYKQMQHTASKNALNTSNLSVIFASNCSACTTSSTLQSSSLFGWWSSNSEILTWRCWRRPLWLKMTILMDAAKKMEVETFRAGNVGRSMPQKNIYTFLIKWSKH